MAELPQPGQRLLRLLLSLLQQVDADATQMTADNLGRVFAMTVIKRQDPTEMAQHATGDAAFVSHLIQCLPALAEPKPEPEPEPEPDDASKVSGNDPATVPEPQPQSEPELDGLGNLDGLDSVDHVGAEPLEPPAPEPEPEESTKETKPEPEQPELAVTPLAGLDSATNLATQQGVTEGVTEGGTAEESNSDSSMRARAESSAPNEKLDDLRSSRAKRSGQAPPSTGKGKSREGGDITAESKPEPDAERESEDNVEKTAAELDTPAPAPEPVTEPAPQVVPAPAPAPEPAVKPEPASV